MPLQLLYSPQTFSISHHSIFFYFLWDPYLSNMSSIPVSLPASHHFLPKPETSTQAFLFFLFIFVFLLQPPIPTTTTSVLSLKLKPTKFISILEAPRKFTNPQQPIRCPNRLFLLLFFFL